MKKINIAELLKDCPKDMELDCTSYENVVFDFIDEESDAYPIHCYMVDDEGNRNALVFTKNGYLARHKNAKCVIFPKGKTTWEGFVPPKFKDGDVAISNYGDIHLLCTEDSSYCAYRHKRNNKLDKIITTNIKIVRLATEEEKQKLFDAIKANGYKWNPETKTLEKLVEPKFKVRDRIKNKRHHISGIIANIYEDGSYKVVYQEGGVSYVCIAHQDDWELVPDKFDINTLKPFESRVLVRNNNKQEWCISLFGNCHENERYKYSCMNGCGYAQCIPYEGNQHLLGKTDDCDEFYKTWK